MKNPEARFLAERGLDPKEWIVYGLRVNANGSVSGSFKRRPGLELSKPTLKKLRSLALKSRKKRTEPGPWNQLLELHVNDWHVGSWTGAQAEEAVGAANRVLQTAKRAFNPGRVLLVLNGDVAHIDSIRGETTKGTRLEDVGMPYEDIFRASVGAIMGIINLAQKVAPVDVLVVPGNHDFHLSFALGEAIRMAYLGNDLVRVDNSTDKYRYYRWGSVLLGFTHGDTGKLANLPSLMASDRPQDWGDCSWKEWHTGHVHQQAQLEKGGVRIRSMPALAGRNAWAANQGYADAHRAIEGYLWNKTTGYVGHLSVSL